MRVLVAALLVQTAWATNGVEGHCMAHCENRCEELNGDIMLECGRCDPRLACNPSAADWPQPRFEQAGRLAGSREVGSDELKTARCVRDCGAGDGCSSNDDTSCRVALGGAEQCTKLVGLGYCAETHRMTRHTWCHCYTACMQARASAPKSPIAAEWEQLSLIDVHEEQLAR